MLKITAIPLAVVSLLAGFTGYVDWKVILAFSAIAQCLMAALETGRTDFLRGAVAVLLAAVLPGLLPVDSVGPWPVGTIARGSEWFSYILSCVTFMFATFVEVTAPVADDDSPRRSFARKNKAISARITSG